MLGCHFICTSILFEIILNSVIFISIHVSEVCLRLYHASKSSNMSHIYSDTYTYIYGYKRDFTSYDKTLILFDIAQFMPAELSIKTIIH